MAANIGSHGVAAFRGSEHPAPAAVVMAYTGHSDISDQEPPTFVMVGGRDRIAPPQVMERRITELRAAGTEVEYHRYESLGHGFGLGAGAEAEGRIGDAVACWKHQLILSQYWPQLSPPDAPFDNMSFPTKPEREPTSLRRQFGLISLKNWA